MVVLLFSFWVCLFLGGRAIHYTYMYMERTKTQVIYGRLSTTKVVSYPQNLEGDSRFLCFFWVGVLGNYPLPDGKGTERT